jgi:glucose/arabinose dehydrogenase
MATKRLAACTAAAFAVLSCATNSYTGVSGFPADSSLALVLVAQGLSFPLYLTSPPGDTARLFVVEKGGTIRVIQHGQLLPTPFLDISGKVTKGGEQGLLGMAFYPDYATSGRFVVDYTSPMGAQGGGTSIIAGYQVSSDSNLADPTESVILTVDQPYTNHNGGEVTFGPDGMLYIGFGDGGSGGDPQGHGQRRDDLLGSILRIDVSGASGYTIPPDNPYVGMAGIAPELWDYGLRNPWRFSFDRANGDLYIGDVGQNVHEEIDVSVAGAQAGVNYGWNIMEGMSCYNANSCNQTGLTLPVVDYTHSDGCAVTGGYVYRGSAAPAANGVYFYSDYCGGWVRSFLYQAGQPTEQTDWPLLSTGGSVPSFGEDANGELYILTASGRVYRVVPR